MNIHKAICTIVGTLLPVLSYSGSVLEVQTTERRGAAPVIGMVEMTTSGSMSRLDIVSGKNGESGTMIFDGNIGKLIVVDHENKQYYVIDQQQMDAMAEKVTKAHRDMEQALASMPPGQRALARQMMQLPEAPPEPPETMLNRTGESDTIGGHDCEFHDVIQEGHRVRDICVTPWDGFQEGRVTAGALLKLGDFFESMRQAFSATGGTSLMDRHSDLFSYMDELDGYPVLSRDYGADGVVEYESRLFSSKMTDVDQAIFSSPEGYTQQPLM